jgi:hypothetical protein
MKIQFSCIAAVGRVVNEMLFFPQASSFPCSKPRAMRAFFFEWFLFLTPPAQANADWNAGAGASHKNFPIVLPFRIFYNQGKERACNEKNIVDNFLLHVCRAVNRRACIYFEVPERAGQRRRPQSEYGRAMHYSERQDV